MVGFNFMDQKEAQEFYKIFTDKSQSVKKPTTSISNVTQINAPHAAVVNVPVPIASNISTKNKKNGSVKGKPIISKDMIGKPQNFEHISHIGFDPIKGFDVTY